MKRGQGLEAKTSSASQQRGRQHSLLCDAEASFTLDLPTRIRQHCELWRICPVSKAMSEDADGHIIYGTLSRLPASRYDWKPYFATPRSVYPQELKRKGTEQTVGVCHESSSPSPHPAFMDKDNPDYTHREREYNRSKRKGDKCRLKCNDSSLHCHFSWCSAIKCIFIEQQERKSHWS